MTARSGCLAMHLLAAIAVAQAPPPAVVLERDLVYAKAGGRELRLDLYRPQTVEAPLPVIVSIHGGGWEAGSKEQSPGTDLAAQGYAVAALEYRLSGEAAFPAQIEDCKAAVRWLRANAGKYNLNPNRMAAYGASAGGHLAVLLGTSSGMADLEGAESNLEYSSRVQAVVDLYGPTDFLAMGGSHNDADSPESRLIGGPIQQNVDKVVRANPIVYIGRDDPPFLIVHGDSDEAVPLRQSQALLTALQAAGVDSSLRVMAEMGHGFGGPEIDKLVLPFLDKHLKRPPVAQWTETDKTAPPGTTYHTFYSAHAQAEADYLLYLPPDYGTAPARRYPVVYWLHGIGSTARAGASFVSRMDAAIRGGTAPAAIVVLVNGMRNSWYIDTADGSLPVESVIIQDLIPHIDKTHRTYPIRAARAVEGFSMGGFGAAHLGFKYPEYFGAVGILSGAMLPATNAGQFTNAFGTDQAYFDANSPRILAEKHSALIRNLSRIRLHVGDQDTAVGRGPQQFHDMMDRVGIPHEWALIPGVTHDVRQMYEALGDRTDRFYSEAFKDLPGTAVVTAAGFAAPIAKDSIAAAFGINLATRFMGSSSVPPPFSLAGTTVRLKDASGRDWPARVIFTSPNQVSFLVPPDVPKGVAQVAVMSGAGVLSLAPAEVNNVAPGLFAANGDGQGVAAGYAVRTRGDGTQRTEVLARYDPVQGRHVAVPLNVEPSAGEVTVALFGTGFRLRSAPGAVTVTLGNQACEVLYAGAQGQYPGLDQVNLRVPPSLAGSGEVTISMAVDSQRANRLTVNIR